MAVCSKCKEEKELVGTVCQRCNTFKVRLFRILKEAKDKDAELGHDFEILSQEEKNKLYSEHHGLHGKDLLMKIWQSTEHVRTTKVNNKMKAKGVFKDKEDMEAKYKDKPLQLQNIFRNAATLVCPTKEVQMWADPEISVSLIYEEIEERQRKLFCESRPKDMKRKREPAAKKVVAAPATAGEAKEEEVSTEVRLTLADVEQIKKPFEALQKELELLAPCLKTASELGEHVQARLLTSIKAWELQTKESLAMIEITFTSFLAETPVKEVRKALAVYMRECKANRRTLLQRIKLGEHDRDAAANGAE
jgi:hypothetical protein